jgi:hypothetical protein
MAERTHAAAGAQCIAFATSSISGKHAGGAESTKACTGRVSPSAQASSHCMFDLMHIAQ